MLHPDFPVISGDYQMTKNWCVTLPGEFNRRIEEGDLVIWRPGMTIWTAVWGNDENKSKEECLSWIKEDISEDAFDISELRENDLLRFKYRLIEESEDERVPAFYCFAVGDSGYVQMAIYFDVEEELENAEFIWKSLKENKLP